MPKADAAMRIQRTPVLVYIGVSLGEEREPAETQHRCLHPGTVPSSPEKWGGEAAPGCPLSPAWRDHTPTPRPRGSSALPRTCVSGPSPVPMSTLCPGESSARLSHAGTSKQPEGVPSFPKHIMVPNANPWGLPCTPGWPRRLPF